MSTDASGEEGLKVRVEFSGKGFEAGSIAPPQPIYVPGDLKSVTLKVRMGEDRAGLKLLCKDGYGRGDADGQSFHLDIPVKKGTDWQTVTVEIPEQMVRPVAIEGILAHNWNTKNQATTVEFVLDELSIEADISQADPATGEHKGWQPADPKVVHHGGKVVPSTPWLGTNLGSSALGHVFAGVPPEITFAARNWRQEPVELTLRLEVRDAAGEVVFGDERKVAVDAVANVSWNPPAPKLGPYRAKLTIQQPGGEPKTLDLRYASLPKPHELTEDEKLRSPYGLNYHGGGGLMLAPFTQAGLVWFREYAWQWDWLARARGEDNRFAGWPNFPAITKAYEDAGVIMLPVLQKSIPRPELKGDEIVGAEPPSREWVQQLAQVLVAFPQVKFWELDNEYDLNAGAQKVEPLLNWGHYEAYHRKFGEVLQVLGNGELVAVENGRAGIFPGPLEKSVKAGAFDDIQVVNVHHYTGVEPPETNIGNFNTGKGGTGARPVGLFADELRATVEAGRADGKERHAWITEFGWDTKAGRIVSEAQQAAYLPRAYMMFAAAGIEKSFWFFHFDSADANNFFDGCGLLDHNRQPKPVLSTLAGLTHLLPQLNHVGAINAGPNTAGHVFEQDGQFVAALWLIKEAPTPVEVTFGDGAKLYDANANPLPGGKVALGIAPVYAVGIPKSGPWFQQTAYALDSMELMPGTASEQTQAVINITNNRERAISCEFTLPLPEGWTGPAAPVKASVQPGETASVAIPFTIAPNEPLGIRWFSIEVREGEVVKSIPFGVRIQTPLSLKVGAVEGTQEKGTVMATVVNQSNQTRDLELKLALPSSWKALEGEKSVTLKPGEVHQAQLRFSWSGDVNAGEQAQVTVADAQGATAAAPIIPPVLRIAQLPAPGWYSGENARWPEQNRVPAWMLGSSFGEADAKAWLGWSEAGLWGALEVANSNVRVTDPRSFWAGDVLELFIGASHSKVTRQFKAGDHQFWLVPLVAENRVYLGRWMQGDMPDNLYDIAGIRSAATQVEGGYTMEFLIPWSVLDGVKPEPGAQLGFSLNLTATGSVATREVYWPRLKEDQTRVNPGVWGALTLGQ